MIYIHFVMGFGPSEVKYIKHNVFLNGIQHLDLDPVCWLRSRPRVELETRPEIKPLISALLPSKLRTH